MMFGVMRLSVRLGMYLKCLVYVAIILSWNIAATRACDLGWTTVGSSCYRVMISGESQGFAHAQAAQETCKWENATLASVTPGDLTDLQGLISAGNEAYVGLSDLASEGTWEFFDNTSSAIIDANPDWSWLNAESLDCAVLGSTSTLSAVPCCFQAGVARVLCQKPDGGTVARNTLIDQHCYQGCDEGWYLLDGRCYSLIPSPNSVYNASVACRSEEAYLGDIDSNELNDLVSLLANSTFVSNISVSLNDLATSDIFVSGDSSTQNNYSIVWSSGTALNTDAHCALVDSPSGNWQNDTMWRNVPCCWDLGEHHAFCYKSVDAVFEAAPCDVFAQNCGQDPCTDGQGVCTPGQPSCACEPGYEGELCEIDLDECLSSPCVYGNCINQLASFNCSCLTGWGGTHCDDLQDACTACGYCNSTGTESCSNALGSALCDENAYTCNCLPGYNGTLCDNGIDECAETVCANGGTCVDGINEARCTCPPTHYGSTCQSAIICEFSGQLTVENATLSAQSAEAASAPVLNSYVNFTCYAGHKFPDMQRSHVYTCGEDGWNITDSEYCEPHCDDLPVIEHSNVYPDASSAVGSTQTFTCHLGYSFPSNITNYATTCLDTFEWDPPLYQLPTCEEVHCPTLPFYPNQWLSTTETRYNTTVIFHCDVGHAIYDGSTARSIYCQEDGEWSAELPTCDPIRCPDDPIPEGSRRNTTSPDYNIYNNYVKYTCQDGLRMLDGASFRIVKCDATEHWSDNVTACTTERCFPLPYVANATPETTDANHGQRTRISCIAGHRFPGNHAWLEMECLGTNRWSPLLPACEPLFCSYPTPAGNNTVLSTTSRLFGTVVQVRCLRGHYYSDGSSVRTIECQEGPQWNDTRTDNCQPIPCPVPPQIENGTRSNVPASPVYDSRVGYTCNDGFKFIDGTISRQARCNEWGTWDNSDVSCQVDRCVPVPEGEHSEPSTRNTSWYVVVSYRCETGYEWTNGRQAYNITCPPGNNGRWSNTNIPPCTIKLCDSVPTAPFATANTSDVTYGTVVEYTCHTGYEVRQDETLTRTRECTVDKTWEPVEIDECEIIHCPELGDILNATKSSNSTYYNAHVNYTCTQGYQFPDSPRRSPITYKTVTCQADKTWTTLSHDYCEVIYCPPVPSWDAQFNSTLNDFDVVVEYRCYPGHAFDSADRDETVTKISRCAEDKTWQPSIKQCQPVEDIAASLKKAVDSEEAKPIGSVALALMGVFVGMIVLLDITKLHADLKIMKRNVQSIWKARRERNKVSVSVDNTGGGNSQA